MNRSSNFMNLPYIEEVKNEDVFTAKDAAMDADQINDIESKVEQIIDLIKAEKTKGNYELAFNYTEWVDGKNMDAGKDVVQRVINILQQRYFVVIDYWEVKSAKISWT